MVVGLEVGEDLWGEGESDGEGIVGIWGVFGGIGGAVVGAEEEDWGGEEEGKLPAWESIVLVREDKE